MKKRKLLALASACVLLVGTGTTVLATGSEEKKEGSTAVTLNVSSYTLTVPATVTVSKAGYTELNGGIKVRADRDDWMHDVTVSATSNNDWKFINTTDEGKTVSYTLCESNSSTDMKKEFDFLNYEIHGGGKTITPYIYVSESAYNDAKDGEYKDTITFTVTGITDPTAAPPTSAAPVRTSEAPAAT